MSVTWIEERSGTLFVYHPWDKGLAEELKEQALPVIWDVSREVWELPYEALTEVQDMLFERGVRLIQLSVPKRNWAEAFFDALKDTSPTSAYKAVEEVLLAHNDGGPREALLTDLAFAYAKFCTSRMPR